MQSKQKLPAFTLIELMITMLISSISFGIIYSGYEIVSKQYQSYKSSNEIIADALYLNVLMASDFSKARNAQKNDDGFQLIDYENKSTIYELSEEYIVRKVSFSTDTFNVPVKNISFLMNNSDVVTEPYWIDEVSFDVNINKQAQTFHYRKQYDAAFLMDNEAEIAK